MLAFVLLVLVFGTAAAAFGGGDWRTAALGGLLGAMNYHIPLIDWI